MNKVDIARVFAIETFGSDTPEFRRCHDIAELVIASAAGRTEIATAWACTAVKDDQSLAAFINKIGEGAISFLVESLIETSVPLIHGGPSVLRQKNTYAAQLKGKGPLVKRVALAIEIINLQDIAKANPAWDDKRRHDYALGAKAIYRECAGVSSFLDAKYQKVRDGVFRSTR
jgi:hypothetical protein